MVTVLLLNWLLGLLAATLASWYLVRLLLAVRAFRRSGCSRTAAGAYITTGFIGLGFALAASTAGSAAVYGWGKSLTPELAILLQVVSALVCSWLAAHLFIRFMARPLQAWFAAEESSRHVG